MRADGTRVQNLTAIMQALPYIMPKRYDAQNWAEENLDEDAIRAYIREKRTAAEYAADMGQHEYRVGLYFRAAAGIDPAYFEAALAACLDADIQLKTGVAGYIPLERLIAVTAR